MIAEFGKSLNTVSVNPWAEAPGSVKSNVLLSDHTGGGQYTILFALAKILKIISKFIGKSPKDV